MKIFLFSRSSRISCESDVAESQGSSSQEAASLGRSASTGMVNVDREAWQRVAEGKQLYKDHKFYATEISPS